MRTLLHLTDLHVAAAGAPRHSGPGSLEALGAILEAVERSPVRPEAIVLSGDLADAGEAGAYARLGAVLGPAAERWGSAVVVCAGNHDDRSALRAAGLGPTGAGAGDDPVDHVLWLTPEGASTERPGTPDDLRVLVLDSSVASLVRGELDDAQLAWAAAELATRAPAGTVVVVHHPPMPSPLGLDVTRLARPERLARLLRATDARIVLCGHAHHGSAAAIGGVPVWMGPAVAAANDVLAPADVYRSRATVGATRIDLGAEWTQANPVLLGGEVLSETSLSAVARSVGANDGPVP